MDGDPTEIAKTMAEATIKETIGAANNIFSELWSSHKAKQKKELNLLAYHLQEIADTLDKVKVKFKEKQIPSNEAVCLDVVVGYATKLAKPFKKKYPKLAEVFDTLLPNVAFQMQLADYVIDGKPRGDLLSEGQNNIRMVFTADEQLDKACEELVKASSAIQEHSKIFRRLSE